MLTIKLQRIVRDEHLHDVTDDNRRGTVKETYSLLNAVFNVCKFIMY